MTFDFEKRLAALDPGVKASIQRQAELGVLKPFLYVNDIAELWGVGGDYSKDAYLEFIKEQIYDHHLVCMTRNEFTKANMAWDEMLRAERAKKLTVVAVFEQRAYAEFFSSQLYVPVNTLCEDQPDSTGSSVVAKPDDRRVYFVKRAEFIKWLIEKKQWPLPEGCLLSKWWDCDEGNKEINKILITDRNQQKEKALQLLIDRIVEKNPTFTTVEVWNNLQKYDTEVCILKQTPETIETLTGNENATIEYSHPINGTVYKPISLKAFKRRYTVARKKIQNNGK